MRHSAHWTVAAALVVALAGCATESDVPPPDAGQEIVPADVRADGLDPIDLAEEQWVFDGVVPDGGEVAFIECEEGEGCFMDRCTENGDCLSGWCVEHMGEGRCTTLCQEDCPAGWSCEEVSWAFPDVLFVCLSQVANLCKPCVTGADCSGTGGTPDVCLDFGSEGRFCGGKCSDTQPCPEGYVCQTATTVDGAESQQCVPETGLCECTDKSVELALATTCTVENEEGLCEGQRVCIEGGLSDCDAPTPEAEVCDGVDNDCDGETDEVTCDDDNPCTDDSCVEGECVFEPNSAPCDDGNDCTIDDKCKEGTCAGVPGGCDCETDEDCAAFEDGDVCNGTLYCNLESFPYQCTVIPETVIECPEPTGIDAPCLAAVCDPDTGACDVVPDAASDGSPCDDGDACTVGETCSDGLCEGGSAANCNDGNPCTDDSCDPAEGCIHVNNTEPCQDGNVCTVGDVCGEGNCQPGEALDCNDDNVCTDDSCDPDTGCQHQANELPCNDGTACTVGDMCNGGTCQPGTALDCDDDNVCTDDSCDPAAGCQHSNNNGGCDDGNACTLADTCSAGQCISGAPLDCDDSNVCTDDSCVVTANGSPKCLHEPNTAPCGDGYQCANGQCNCVPDCEGKVCGPDGCGGFCWQEGPPLCEKQAGVCEGAVKSEDLCVNGAWTACGKTQYFFNDNNYQDAETLCDLLDNDCDGQIDEDLGETTCGLGNCNHTVPNCANGELQVCNPLEGQADETCDGEDNDCNGLIDDGLGSTTCGVGPCYHTQPNCLDGQEVPCDPFFGALPEQLDGIDNDCDGQTDEGFPVPGTIIITEIMANPDCVVDADGEWIELYNTTDETWDLNGWILKDVDNDKITIDNGGPLLVAGGSYLVLGRNGNSGTNGGVAIDYVYNGADFVLANSATGDEAILVGPGSVEVDKVAWSTALGFPDQNSGKGRSMSLSPAAYDHEQNDDGANWFQCDVAIVGGCGDKGTPGALNE